MFVDATIEERRCCCAASRVDLWGNFVAVRERDEKLVLVFFDVPVLLALGFVGSQMMMTPSENNFPTPNC